MIELRPSAGRSLRDLRQSLQQVHDEAYNAVRDRRTAVEDYAKWARTAVDTLDGALAGFRAANLLYTPHYFALFSADDATAQSQVNAVRDTLTSTLRRLIQGVERLERWWQGAGVVVVLDTNMLVQTRDLFDEIDWPAALQIPDHVSLVVPLAVVDELDRLKRDSKARDHARRALARLEALLRASDMREALPEVGAKHSLRTTIEVLGEPLDYARLVDVDSEIVRRATWLRDMRCGDVHFATLDTGARFRAAGEGLPVKALPSELLRE